MIQIPEHFQKDLDLAVKILKAAGCREIFIFGPLANGEARANSEIDLAIRGCPPNLFFKTWGQLLSQLEHSTHLVDLEDEDDPLVQFIKKRGDLGRVA